MSNRTDATYDARSAYPSRANVFGTVRVAQPLVFYFVFCVLLFFW